ncbi:MAG: cadherin-like domain-containing protein [Sphingomonadaceae bacterium]|nr:cadherin-like domain-containing protein [Sphingomonadaceae bacterium]
MSDGPTSGADTLIGGIGDDYLQGFDGDDILDGGAGEDEMWGGAGDDTYYLDNRNDQVHELGDNGQDTAIISFDWPYGFTIPWQVETLVLVGPATNAFGYGGAETLIGNELDNRLSGVGGDDTLIGNGGNDELIGGAGNDRLEGGLGDDIFSVDSPADIVIELAGEGDDLINSSVSLTLPSGVERLTLASGSQTLSGTGNDLANVIIGNAGDNALSGADGDDALFGEAGHDILTGGAGNDMLDGGDGDDIAAFSGNYDDYEITQNDGSVHIIDQRVSAGDGMDTATNVEVLRFADGDYDAATGAKIGDGGGPPAAAMFSLGTGVVGDIAFSPDSKTLYTARGGTITAFDMATGSATQSWAFGTNLGGIDVSLDGKYLVATERELGPTTQLDFPYFSIEIYAYRIDLTTGISTKFTDTSSLSANYFSDVSFLPDGKALLSHFNAYGSEPFTILDFDTGTFEPNETHIGGTVIATPDKSKILLSDHQLPYALYTSADGTLEHDAEAVDFDTGFIRGISPAGNFIVQGRALNVYDANQELIASVPSDEPYLGVQVTGLAFGPAGDIAYILNRDSNTIYTLETSGWSVIGGYPVQSKPVEYPSFGNGLLASNDGRYLAAMTETGVQVIDTTLAENTAPTSGPDMLLGDSSDNYIYGFDGDDVIDGLLGRDLMIGGRGNDSYYVDQINDVILEDSDEGFDTVFVNYETYPSYTLPLWVEALTLIGSTIQASGNYQANILTGNNLDNRLFAKAGDDELIGNGGNDELIGEAGNDALYGGADNDTLLGGPGNDFLDGGEGDDAAIFGGNRSDYLITQENGNVRFVDQRVDNSDGEDLATNIEVFHLADGDFGTTSVAINDDASATAGLSTLIDVLGNDVRAIDAVAMSVVSTGNLAHGIVTINSDESVTYTAYSGFSGTDSFEYTIMDGTGGSDTATVTVFVEAASSQSQLIAKDGFVGSLGGGGKVYGTAGLQDITILDIPGSSDLDASFNKGGSIVRLHGNASDWQIVQSGSSAIFLDGDTFVQVPAGAVGLTVVFEDGVRLLQIDLIAGTLKIGSQAFGETLVTINAPADASPIPFGADPAASATLILAPGASVTTAGKLNIFGTGSNETVHLISGDAILDASFNGGGDTLLLDPPASEFTGNQIGSTVLLDSASTDIHIPVGIEGMAIKFGESDERTLIINTVSQTIMIDMQEIGLIPVALSEFA